MKQFYTHTLFDPNDLLAHNEDVLPKAYQGFTGLLASKNLSPERPIDTIEVVSSSASITLPDVFVNKNGKLKSQVKLGANSIEVYEKVPTIDELPAYKGHKARTPFKGGETTALAMLEKYCADADKVASFRKPMTNPVSLRPDTTALSPYLKFGALSPRTFFWRVKDIYAKRRGNHS